MKLFLFTLLITFPTYVFGQKVEKVDDLKHSIFYKLKFLPNTDHPEDLKEEVMLLQVGSSISKFFPYRNYLKDSVVLATGNHQSTIPHSNFRFEVFKNYPEGQLTQTDYIILLRFHYQEVLKPLDWKIHEKVEIIAGHKCQKATTHFAGRDYIAWFTTEIPLQDAPYKFDGLPGFILKVQDTKKHYTFEFMHIEKNKSEASFIYKKRTHSRKVTRVELLEKQREIHTRSMTSILGDYGITVTSGSEEQDRKAQQNVRRFNNYLELE